VVRASLCGDWEGSVGPLLHRVSNQYDVFDCPKRVTHAGRHRGRAYVLSAPYVERQSPRPRAPPVVVILETQRLTLRHLERADLPELYALYRDPEIRRYFPDGTRTLEQTRDELEWFLHGHPHHPQLGLWATVEKRTGSFLGRCGLIPWSIDGRLEVELAYLIDKPRWGEGLATEAARGIVAHARMSLGLSRLICLIVPGNQRSAAVAEKLGMRFEREHTDEFGLCHIYAMSL
jgi:ribosomal-protein-alanine N-acetyltransferase